MLYYVILKRNIKVYYFVLRRNIYHIILQNIIVRCVILQYNAVSQYITVQYNIINYITFRSFAIHSTARSIADFYTHRLIRRQIQQGPLPMIGRLAHSSIYGLINRQAAAFIHSYAPAVLRAPHGPFGQDLWTGWPTPCGISAFAICGKIIQRTILQNNALCYINARYIILLRYIVIYYNRIYHVILRCIPHRCSILLAGLSLPEFARPLIRSQIQLASRQICLFSGHPSLIFWLGSRQGDPYAHAFAHPFIRRLARSLMFL